MNLKRKIEKMIFFFTTLILNPGGYKFFSFSFSLYHIPHKILKINKRKDDWNEKLV